MKLTQDQFEGALEILNRCNMLGETDDMDDEEKMDIIESYANCNYLYFMELNKRPVVIFEDDTNTAYMWADSFRDLNDKEIDALFALKENQN